MIPRFPTTGLFRLPWRRARSLTGRPQLTEIMLSLVIAALLPASGPTAEADPPTTPIPDATVPPQAIFNKAVQLFFTGQPSEAALLFDTLLDRRPELAPSLWQRGLALYYAERYEDGRQQFELHQTVNPNDVENSVWHYLCVARAEFPEQARRKLLPVRTDDRVPMREILALFKGDGTEAAVLTAASKGEGDQRRNQLCYAHLYLGLYAEANGDNDRARQHMLLAADQYGMDHFMGRVAKLHAQLRAWIRTDSVTAREPFSTESP